MKKLNKLVCFMVVFITVMSAFCTVSFGANIKQFDLSKWQKVNINYSGSQPCSKFSQQKGYPERGSPSVVVKKLFSEFFINGIYIACLLFECLIMV